MSRPRRNNDDALISYEEMSLLKDTAPTPSVYTPPVSGQLHRIRYFLETPTLILYSGTCLLPIAYPQGESAKGDPHTYFIIPQPEATYRLATWRVMTNGKAGVPFTYLNPSELLDAHMTKCRALTQSECVALGGFRIPGATFLGVWLSNGHILVPYAVSRRAKKGTTGAILVLSEYDNLLLDRRTIPFELVYPGRTDKK